MTAKWTTAAAGTQHPLRHGLAFLLSGSLAFLVDAGILQGLVALLGIPPILARIVSLSCAHAAGWLSHRRFTFRMTTPPTVAEFLRYAGVQSTVALLNYGIFALILVLRPGMQPLLGLLISSGIAMFFSYFGIRFGAFRQDGAGGLRHPQHEPPRLSAPARAGSPGASNSGFDAGERSALVSRALDPTSRHQR